MRWARSKGMVVLKLNLMGNRGWPDTLYLFQYPFIAFLEFKRLGGKPDPLQEMRIEDLQRRGYPAACVDNVGDAIDFLERVRNNVQVAVPSLRGP